MKLSELIQYLPGTRSEAILCPRIAGERTVLGLTPRLRDVRPGMAFFALPDQSRTNPHAAQTAYERGAALVVCGPDLSVPARAPSIRVTDPHAALARAAAAFRQFPADRLTLVAVTGDPSLRRGVAALITSILNALGLTTGFFGRHGYDVAGRRGMAPLSAIDVSEMHALLGQQVAAGGRCAVMEFDTAAFPEGLTGLRFARQIAVNPSATFRHSRPILLNPRGSRIEIRSTPTPVTATTPLIGRRSLLALDLAWPEIVAIAATFGHSAAAVRNALPILAPVPGWLEPVQCGQPFGVLVDHATCAEDLGSALRTARELTRNRLHVVCGPQAAASAVENAALGNTARALADHIHLTADNPRNRVFQELQNEMLGASTLANLTIQPDRESAIRGAIRSARTGDVIVLAGKADAPIQEIGSTIIPFDDRQVAARALHARGYVGGGD